MTPTRRRPVAGVLAAWCGLLTLTPVSAGANLASLTVFTQDRDAYGNFIQQLTQQLYSSDLSSCAGAAYSCGGILVSGFEQSGDYWMQAWPGLSKISLSFWMQRTTGLARKPEDGVFTPGGFMLWPAPLLKKYSEGPVFTPEFTCAFANDGATGNQLRDGCGGWYHAIPKCQDLGLKTKDDFIRYYNDPEDNQCGFALGRLNHEDRDAFETTLALQVYAAKVRGSSRYDEVLIKGWPAFRPERIPLLGFYYVDLDGMREHRGNLSAAQDNQRSFWTKTHIFAPVLRVRGADWGHLRFEYAADDQSEAIPERVSVLADVRRQAGVR
ncbi:hypothetical protein D3Z09_18195 [Rahnella aquatilis]|nr:hypothetical protein D3Z09_18195 [Rahnella aquatilis]